MHEWFQQSPPEEETMADTHRKQSHARGLAVFRIFLGIAQMTGAVLSFGFLALEGFTARTAVLICTTFALTAISMALRLRGTWGR